MSRTRMTVVRSLSLTVLVAASAGCAQEVGAEAEESAQSLTQQTLYSATADSVATPAQAASRVRSQFPNNLVAGRMVMNVFDAFDASRSVPATWDSSAFTGTLLPAGYVRSGANQPFDVVAGWKSDVMVLFLNSYQDGPVSGPQIDYGVDAGDGTPHDGLRSVNPTYWWALGTKCDARCPLAFPRGGELSITFDLKVPHIHSFGGTAAYVNPYVLLTDGRTELFVGGSVIDSRPGIIQNRVHVDNAGPGGTGRVIATSSLRGDARYASLRAGVARDGVSRDRARVDFESFDVRITPADLQRALQDARASCPGEACQRLDVSADPSRFRIALVTLNAEIYDRDRAGWAQLGASVRRFSLRTVSR